VREIVAVVIAVDSPTGRLAEAINDLTAHLPSPTDPTQCPMCSARFWPCGGFDAAAYRVQAAGLRVADLVPLDLHPRLWPPTRHEPSQSGDPRGKGGDR
jgi:hypothetical protein